MVTHSISRTLTKTGLSFLAIAPLLLLSTINPAGARPSGNNQDDQVARSLVSCGVRVYMTASGATSADTTNDAATKASLENGTDLCVTIGVQYSELSTVSGSVTPSNFDVMYVQGQNNWTSSYLAAFSPTDYAVIDSFISAGAGVVIGEWLAWDACATSFAGAWGSLDAIMPTTIRSNCDYGSNMNVRFYRWERPTTASLDTGVSQDFIFQPADYAGSLSFLTLKPGATPYYWATWDSNVANIPVATDPANLPSAGGVGMAGWVPTGKSGRVFSFSTTNGAPELADTSASNSIRRLLINSLGWAGSVGGAITPDAVAASGSVGTSMSTPAMTPSKITGSVTYSITNGSLPAGLTFDPTTGAITGTPTSGGNSSITVQAVGSTSGAATATIVINIAGSQSTVAPSTTVAPSSTVAPTTTVASPTIANNNITTTTSAAATVSQRSISSLPATGGTSGLANYALLIMTTGALTTVARRRLYK